MRVRDGSSRAGAAATLQFACTTPSCGDAGTVSPVVCVAADAFMSMRESVAVSELYAHQRNAAQWHSQESGV